MGKTLIVGQGLAGTLISHQCYLRQIPVTVVDPNIMNNATHAAAGLVNPLTGRLFTKSWMFDSLLEKLDQTYAQLEDLLNEKFIKSIEIWRVLKSITHENHWMIRECDPEYQDYFGERQAIQEKFPYFRGQKSYIEIKKARRVDIHMLMLSYRKWLISRDAFIQQSFDFNQLELKPGELIYLGESYERVVFCEGSWVLQNPYFNHLPFQPAKGQALIIEADLAKDVAIKNGPFLVHEEDNRYWSGGGYEWQTSDPKPTDEFKVKQFQQIDDWLDIPFELVNHKAGIRPSTKDRKPIIGRHPLHPNVYLFNGLGTKGTSLGPFFAEHLMDFILKDKPLLKEVDLLRFS